MSINLLSSLVSISASTFSEGSSGRLGSAVLIISISCGITSNPFGACGEDFTVPLTEITHSLPNESINLKISSETFFLGAVICAIPSLSLNKINLIPPRSLLSWTHPEITTSSPSFNLSE